MASHFLLLVPGATAPAKDVDEPRAQAKLGAMMLGGFVAAAYVIGWLMFPFPL